VRGKRSSSQREIIERLTEDKREGEIERVRERATVPQCIMRGEEGTGTYEPRFGVGQPDGEA
jgi:hypothetical protein